MAQNAWEIDLKALRGLEVEATKLPILPILAQTTAPDVGNS